LQKFDSNTVLLVYVDRTAVLKYVLRRIGQSVIVLLVVALLVFLLLHMLPGGPARAILGARATPQEVHNFNVANGYNKPVVVQYFDWLNQLIHGRLGYSQKTNQSVSSLFAVDLPKSLLITVPAMLIALLIALPTGLYQASRRNKVVDHIITGVSLVFYSMPVFWLALMLILYVAVDAHWLPPEAPQGTSVGQILQSADGLILPIATLSLITIALFTRYLRSAAIDNLLQDYVRTAKAKGVSNRRILWGHVFKNALLSTVTLVGLSLPGVVSGAVVTETVFNYPGVGYLFWTSAQSRDYPVVLGFLLLVGAATVLGSLLADLSLVALDPRIRLQK
jgi:peptide/nickel transport system permease protein